MHQNLDKLEELDVNMYIVSNDSPEEQMQLYSALEEDFGSSVPFVSDPDMELIESLNMENGESASRGYALLDTEGNLVFNTVNDHWGEEFDKTEKEIKEEFEKLK